MLRSCLKKSAQIRFMIRNKKKHTKIDRMTKKTNQSQNAQELLQLDADVKHLIKILNRLQYGQFLTYLRSKKIIFVNNFLAGLSHGFGVVVGMTLVVAIVGWFLTQMIDFPLVGQYFSDLKDLLENLPTKIHTEAVE